MKSVKSKVFVDPENKLYEYLYENCLDELRGKVWRGVAESAWVQISNPIIDMISGYIANET